MPYAHLEWEILQIYCEEINQIFLWLSFTFCLLALKVGISTTNMPSFNKKIVLVNIIQLHANTYTHLEPLGAAGGRVKLYYSRVEISFYKLWLF